MDYVGPSTHGVHETASGRLGTGAARGCPRVALQRMQQRTRSAPHRWPDCDCCILQGILSDKERENSPVTSAADSLDSAWALHEASTHQHQPARAKALWTGAQQHLSSSALLFCSLTVPSPHDDHSDCAHNVTDVKRASNATGFKTWQTPRVVVKLYLRAFSSGTTAAK